MKSGGGDDALREEVTGFGVKPQRPVLAPEPEEPGARADVAARFLDRRCHLLGDGAEGDDPRRGGVDRGHPSSVRLDLTKLLRRNRAKPGNPVLPPPLQKRLEPWSLLFGGRDDDFPRELEGNAILFAKAHHLRRPPDGNARPTPTIPPPTTTTSYTEAVMDRGRPRRQRAGTWYFAA